MGVCTVLCMKAVAQYNFICIFYLCLVRKMLQYPIGYCLISNFKFFFLSSVQCLPAPNITCKDHLGVEKVFTGHEVGFYKPIACRNV